MTDVTNQDDGFDPEVDGVADDQNTDQDNDQANEDDESEEGSQDEEDELEEVERDGKKHRVSKALKAELMLHADYTRKTQETAALRKDLESRITKAEETSAEIEDARLSLRAIDTRIADLRALTPEMWSQLRQMDAQDGGDRYDRLQREKMDLPLTREETKTKLDAKTKEVLEARQKVLDKRQEEGHAVLTRDIPGWGPDLGAKLTKFVGEMGITEQSHPELFASPEAIKLAYAAFKNSTDNRKAALQAKADSAERNKPAAQVKGHGSTRVSLDRMSAAEFAAYRDKQVGPGR